MARNILHPRKCSLWITGPSPMPANTENEACDCDERIGRGFHCPHAGQLVLENNSGVVRQFKLHCRACRDVYVVDVHPGASINTCHCGAYGGQVKVEVLS